MVESREKRRETRLPGADSRTSVGERGRQPLRSTEYLRNGSEKNVHRRAGKVKERVRMSIARGRERKREKARTIERSEGEIRREDGKRERKRPSSPIEPAEFYPKLGATSSPSVSFSTSSTFHFISLPRAFRSHHPVLLSRILLSLFLSRITHCYHGIIERRDRNKAGERTREKERERDDSARKRKTERDDSRRISMLTTKPS